MAQRSRFADAVSGSPIYTAADFAGVFSATWLRDGVVAGAEDGLVVTATSPESMAVQVGLGRAWVQGREFEVFSAAETLNITAADPSLPRIDRVVVRLSFDPGADPVTLAVKTGTAAPSPTPPGLQRDSSIYELSLAQVAVGAGVTTITAGDITDERGDESVCGYTAPHWLHVGPAALFPATDGGADLGTPTQRWGRAFFSGIVTAKVPYARVFHSLDQSIPSNTQTVLAFNSERWDTDNMHDPGVNNRLTCNTPGLYVITAQVAFGPSATGSRELRIILNGILTLVDIELPAKPTGVTAVSGATVYKLDAGDFVQVQVFQNSGGALAVQSISNHSPEFAMVRVAD